MQVLNVIDMRSILDVDDTEYSIPGAYAMQETDILEMTSILDMDDTKYSISAAYAMQVLGM